MIAELFFLSDLRDHSDRSDHMGTGLNPSQKPSTLPPQLQPVRLTNISNALFYAPITPSL